MKRKRLLLILGCLAAVVLAGYGTLWLRASRQTESEIEARMMRWTGNEPFLDKIRRWLGMQ